MKAIRILLWLNILWLFAAILFVSCKSNSNNSTKSNQSDQDQIQAVLDEAVERWKYGDKGVLYDNEFECIRERFNFDEYLRFGEVAVNADSLSKIKVVKVQFFGHDSALADVDVVFEGPTKRISHAYDKYMLYWQNGRWIRPTIGTSASQREYEQNKRAADSAAEAEAKELEGVD